MNIKLDEKLKQLKSLEDQIVLLTSEKEQIRKEAFDIIEAETDGQYKNDIATISKVEKKIIKFIKETDTILEEIKDLPKYYSVIPEEIIPEHKELNKTFEKDVKDGVFKIDGVEVETKTNVMIRFNT
jgi:septal ring factor EnvC (AmiA/AmiB activator)